MAYGNYIAVVDWLDIIKLREDLQQTVQPLKIGFVSHLASYWVKEKPLGEYLAQILDGGQELSPSFWHPFRVPRVHSPDAVRSLQSNLQAAWSEISPEAQAANAFQHDITEILLILKTAVAHESAVMSVLEPPADEERAKRVACPFDQFDKLPVRWGNLSAIYKGLR